MLKPLTRLLTVLMTSVIWLKPVQADDNGVSSPRVSTSTVTPWGIVSDDGSAAGILVDFQKILFERAGVPMNLRMEPYPRVIQSIRSGTADVAVMFVSPESQRIAISLGKVVDEQIVIVTLADRPPVHSLDDFNGKLVGQVRGSRYGKDFDQHPGIVRTPVTDVEQGLKMLLSGRIEAMTSTQHSLLYAMYTASIDSNRIRIALPLFTAQADLYVSRQAATEPWVDLLHKALQTMTEDGTLHPALYQHDYWPYATFCFAGGNCLNTH